MAERYRSFKRIKMTARTARALRDNLVDRTLDHHYRACDGSEPCCHTESKSLDVARMVEPRLRIGKTRATLDLPDDSELVKAFADRVRGFAGTVPWGVSAFDRIASEAWSWAARGPLERLAEVYDG